MPLVGSCTGTIALDVVENAYNRITTHLDEYIANWCINHLDRYVKWPKLFQL